MMGYLLGIDVGTTRTVAAIGRPEARPGEIEIVDLGDRSSAVPSVIYVGDDGSVLVGDAAERRAGTDPDHVVRDFERRIGDPNPIVVAGRSWAPEELSALLVRWVVDRVTQREGDHADRITVTHRASWGSHAQDRMGGALAGQGVPVTFLAEPQAAALHFAAAERLERGSTIAVYDLGGGTLDAAVVHKDGQGFGLLGRPEGLRLGGVDFDEAVFDHVCEALPEAFEGLDDTDPAVLSAIAAVRRECAEAKEALSSEWEVSIPVLTPASQGSVRLRRSEFEALIWPRVEETVDALSRTIDSARLVPAQLSAVLLVGGSSRVPLVARLVSEQLGRPVAVDADPKDAIALGAALSMTRAGVSASGGAAVHRSGPSGQHTVVADAGAAAGTSLFEPSGPSSSGPHRSGPIPTTVIGSGPLTRRVPSGPAMPPSPPRPGAYPGRPPPDPAGDSDVEYADERPGRSPALLVSAGGATAAVAVIAAVFLWPSGSPISTDAGLLRPIVPTSVAPPASSTPPPTTAAEPTTEKPAPPPRRRTTTPPPPPPPVTTPPPATTTAPPTTTPPTTSPSAPTSTTPTPAGGPPPPSGSAGPA